MIPRAKLQKIIQKFHDEMVESQEFQDMVAEYTIKAETTGISDPILLEKAFEYLDTKCQEKLREYIKNQEKKNERPKKDLNY